LGNKGVTTRRIKKIFLLYYRTKGYLFLRYNNLTFGSNLARTW